MPIPRNTPSQTTLPPCRIRPRRTAHAWRKPRAATTATTFAATTMCRPRSSAAQLPTASLECSYGEMAEKLPLKEWKVIPPWCDWFNVEHWVGDDHHWVQQVWGATRSQAKYLAYQELQDKQGDVLLQSTACLPLVCYPPAHWYISPDLSARTLHSHHPCRCTTHRASHRA
ncbi:exported protein of unknown function [Pseudomonas sp. JV241A]|nr:exported protein of unknown function [Pseudomonas sp. JV241A]